MTRYVAFLRAINVGGHVVKMETLRRQFESLGFDNVSTFIASGNVIFDVARGAPEVLEARIEQRLQQTLTYRVATFLRTIPEVSKAAEHCGAYASEIEAGAVLYVAFGRREPAAPAKRRLTALNNDVDEFHVRGRDIFWLCRRYRGDSKLTGGMVEKASAIEATVRNATTVRKIAAKYC